MIFLLASSALTMTASGLLMLALERQYHAPDAAPRRLSPPRPVDDAEQRRLFGINSALSVVLLLGVPYLAFDRLFDDTTPTPGRLVFEVAAILSLYDLGYYAFHRTLHHKRLMRYVHRVHHLVRATTARGSMYVHPAEFTGGLALLFAVVALIGPVSVTSYAVALVPFQLVNVVLHSGLSWPGHRWLDRWARGHHVHHGVDVQHNFGQFTPLWDHLFGTAHP